MDWAFEMGYVSSLMSRAQMWIPSSQYLWVQSSFMVYLLGVRFGDSWWRTKRGWAGLLLCITMAGSPVNWRGRRAVVYGVPMSRRGVGSGWVGSAPSDMEVVMYWDGIHWGRSSDLRGSERSVPIRYINAWYIQCFAEYGEIFRDPQICRAPLWCGWEAEGEFPVVLDSACA